jgi:adenosine/AMP kinase
MSSTVGTGLRAFSSQTFASFARLQQMHALNPAMPKAAFGIARTEADGMVLGRMVMNSNQPRWRYASARLRIQFDDCFVTKKGFKAAA